MSTRWIIPMGALWTTAALAGCTVESADNNPFGTATTPVTSAPPMNDTGDEDTGGSGSTGSGGGGGSSGGGDTTGGGGSTGPATTTNTTQTTDPTTMGGGSTGDGGPTGMQPGMGMYSPCTVAAECDFLCITIEDAGGVVEGFCSDFPCTNPVADCDPSPGGTAVPACVGIDINGMPDTACYLDCSGGATCPTPMECASVVGGLFICV